MFGQGRPIYHTAFGGILNIASKPPNSPPLAYFLFSSIISEMHVFFFFSMIILA